MFHHSTYCIYKEPDEKSHRQWLVFDPVLLHAATDRRSSFGASEAFKLDNMPIALLFVDFVYYMYLLLFLARSYLLEEVSSSYLSCYVIFPQDSSC